MNRLRDYGLNEDFLREAGRYPELEAGRVVSQAKDLYKVVTAEGTYLAKVAGRFHYDTTALVDYPCCRGFCDGGSGQ